MVRATMHVCDICGDIVNEVYGFSELLKMPAGVTDACDKCRTIADKLLEKYRVMAWRRARKKLLRIRKAKQTSIFIKNLKK